MRVERKKREESKGERVNRGRHVRCIEKRGMEEIAQRWHRENKAYTEVKKGDTVWFKTGNNSDRRLKKECI